MVSNSFLAELWTEYSIGSLIVLTRLLLRLKTRGWRGLEPDDYLVVVAWAIYTIEIPMAYVIILVTKGTNAGMTDEQRRNVSGEELAARVLGAKCFITGWLCYAGTVWILKLCVGFFFQRITEGLPQQRFIKPAMGYVLATWVTTSLFLFLNCRPFHAYWQVDPNPGKQCTFEDGTPFILGLVLNISSDIVLMLIPIPVIMRARISPARKAILCLMFSAGFFVMVAASLRVVFFYTAVDPTLPAIWSCRETFVAFCVTNSMIIGPLARKLWKKRYSDTATSGHPYRSKPVELSGSSKHSSGGDPERNKNNVYFCKDRTKVTASDSTEHIVDSNMSTVGSVIQTETTFQVSSAERGLHSLPPYSVHVGS